jgi:signal transduction histidine kinase
MGMRERAEKIGGFFDVVSQPGLGAEVTVKAPLPRNHDSIAHSGSTTFSESINSLEPPITLD